MKFASEMHSRHKILVERERTNLFYALAAWSAKQGGLIPVTLRSHAKIVKSFTISCPCTICNSARKHAQHTLRAELQSRFSQAEIAEFLGQLA